MAHGLTMMVRSVLTSLRPLVAVPPPVSAPWTSYCKTGLTLVRCKGHQPVEVVGDEETLLVIQPHKRWGVVEGPFVPVEYQLEEAVSLVEAISGWKVHDTRIDTLRKPHNQFLFGKGKIEELKSVVRGTQAVTGVFINTPLLTPVQHGSLESLFRANVYDRFGIVLQIFKERAHTAEAKIQVQLAEIPYVKARLREVLTDSDHHKGGGGKGGGGVGKMGGSGETPVAVAKQILLRKEKALKEKLEQLHKKQDVITHTDRAKQQKFPIVAVVGYTNAGKTSLVKALTKDSSMEPKDMLFATLDTTAHLGKLPSGLKVLYVDTIGFISDLPHELVESFSVTLREVVSADVIVHVRDASHPQCFAQAANVMRTLEKLDVPDEVLDQVVQVLNKVDKLPSVENDSPPHSRQPSSDDTPSMEEEVDSTPLNPRPPDPVNPLIEQSLRGGGSTLPISATKHQGIDALLCQIEQSVMKSCNLRKLALTVPAYGMELGWLYQNATVCSVAPAAKNSNVNKGLEAEGISSASESLVVTAILSEPGFAKFSHQFGRLVRVQHHS